MLLLLYSTLTLSIIKRPRIIYTFQAEFTTPANADEFSHDDDLLIPDHDETYYVMTLSSRLVLRVMMTRKAKPFILFNRAKLDGYGSKVGVSKREFALIGSNSELVYASLKQLEGVDDDTTREVITPPEGKVKGLSVTMTGGKRYVVLTKPKGGNSVPVMRLDKEEWNRFIGFSEFIHHLFLERAEEEKRRRRRRVISNAERDSRKKTISPN